MQEQRGIAICITIVDVLPHEHIWRQWLEHATAQSSPYKAELYIHAKNPDRIRSRWVKSKLVKTGIRPEWNSPEVIRAMLALLSAALEDPSNGRFIFVTESCIPIYDLNHIGTEIFEQEKSWLDAFDTPKVPQLLNCIAQLLVSRGSIAISIQVQLCGNLSLLLLF